MRRVLLGIGSNVDRRAAVNDALTALRERFGHVQSSPVYECPAVGFEGPPFYNLVAQFHSEVLPAQIDRSLREIEDRLGRRRSVQQYSDRRIDLDLLIVGHLVFEEGRVRLPREDVLRYAFALGPLADLAPEFVHPVVGRPIGLLWREMRASDPGACELRRVTC